MKDARRSPRPRATLYRWLDEMRSNSAAAGRTRLQLLMAPAAVALGVAAFLTRGQFGSSVPTYGSRAYASRGAALRTQPANPDPCALVPRAEVERWLGRLASDPVRVEGARRGDPAADGHACVYQLEDGPAGTPRTVAVEVATHDAAIGDDDDEGVGPAPPRDASAGWDYVRAVPGQSFAARRGDVAVAVNVQASGLAPEAVSALAARFVAAVPDLPVAAPPGDAHEPGDAGDADGSPRDPCVLVTRDEAEAVLGPLVVPPHRARASTALADPGGSSCAYHTAGHRVLVLSPTWSMGRATYAMLRPAGQALGRLFAGERAADTLRDVRWDRAAAGLDGRLLLLRGDRLLEVKYRASSTDAVGALEIARSALRRL